MATKKELQAQAEAAAQAAAAQTTTQEPTAQEPAETTSQVNMDSMFDFQEVSIGVEDVMKFELPGDGIIGYVRKVSSMNTKKGRSEYIELNTVDGQANIIMNPETGEPLKTTVFLSAGLVNYPWDEFINKPVKIEYTGEQFNPRSGQTFKCFKVQVGRR